MALQWPQYIWITRAPGTGNSVFDTKVNAEGYAKFIRDNGAFDIEICNYTKVGEPTLAICSEASKPVLLKTKQKGK